MSMRQWDEITAPVLGSIKRHAGWLDYHSRNLSDAIMLLPARPVFQTEAEAELTKAEAECLSALQRVRAALKAYESKPVEGAAHLQAAE